MTTDKSDQGKPTCCGPGDLSACKIETTDVRDKVDSNGKPTKKDAETDETKKAEKAQRTTAGAFLEVGAR